ncbi:contactin-4-like isoform X2 [Oreochromis niloticus]|nr:contactin-4-like isoform X2 [Oreochromis niloticus]
MLYRDGYFVLDYQHPSFKNRVDLQDRQMKDGDVSLILKDVTINDTGTYECRVIQERTNRKRALLKTRPISIIYLRVVDPPDQENITVQYGQSVILPCQAPNDKDSIRVVRWTKPGLQDENVYLYQDGRFDPKEQNPIFKNRVDLQDKEMKNGTASLILRNVTTDDLGAYECLILQSAATISSNNHISIIYLSVVDPPGQPGGDTEDGSVGLKVGLSVCAALLVAVASFLIYRKHKQQKNQDSYSPANCRLVEMLQTSSMA